MGWRRLLLLLLFLAATGLLLVWRFMPRPLAVELIQVTRGPLRVSVEEEGKTRVIDRYVVSAPVAGFARRLKLDVGDSVKRGQVVATLDPLRSRVLDPRSRAEAQARVASAEARLKVARENVQAAAADTRYWKSELDRVTQLYQRGVAPRGEQEHAEAEARRTQATENSSKFAVEVARFEVEAAQTALRYSATAGKPSPSEIVPIRSPVAGRVLTIFRESEGVVGAGQSLVEVGNPEALEVESEVLSSDAVKITPGMPVLFGRWGGDGDLQGRVRLVEPVGFTKVSALGVEEQRVLVIADIVSPTETWDRLGHGYRVEASFVLWEGEEVLQLPSSALFRYQDGWAVFLVENEMARRRPVEVGHRSGLKAEILSGLDPGESVIVHPDDALEDGVQVQMRSKQQ